MAKTAKPGVGPIFLTVFLDLVGFGIVMPFLALEARGIYGVSEGVATLLGASYSLAQFVFVPFWGRLSDRVGRRPVLLISVFLTFVTMAALGLALAYGQSVVWLFLARAFGGMATANLGTASAYIADVTTPQDRVKGMGLIGMAFGLGFIIGPGLGGLLAAIPLNGREGPWACFVAAFLSLINLVWVYRGVPESLVVRKKASRSVAKRYLWPLNRERLQVLQGPEPRYGAVMTNFLIILAFSSLEMTFAFFAKDRFSLTTPQVGMLFVYLGVVAAAIQGGFIRRAGARFHDGNLAVVGVILQALGFAGIALAPQWGLGALVTASGALAIGNGLTQPSLSGFLSRRSAPSQQGAVLGVHHSFAALARVFGPALGGYLYTVAGAVAPFWVGGLINLLALGVAVRLRRSPVPAAA